MINELEKPIKYRVFLREIGNPFIDFEDLDLAWSYAQSFPREKVPYIHPIRPNGPEFPVKH